MKSDVFIQVGTRPKGSGTVRARVRLLAAVGAGVLGETSGDAETLAANPAAERPHAAVDALMILQMGQLAEALTTCGALVEEQRRGEKVREARKLSSQLWQHTNSTAINS